MSISKIARGHVRKAKRAFTTRRVPAGKMRTLVSGNEKPRAGDLVMATIVEIGSHQRIELTNGRRARLSHGDQIIVCYGNRYAPDQFEALVADDLGSCDLVAGGGVAGRETCRHDRMLAPTRIMPLGLVGDVEGRRLNIADYAIDFSRASTAIPTIAVVGTSMNSGKTMTAGSIIRGLSAAGLKVAGIKATGTGSGNDLWLMRDMGASWTLDFTDAGFASTYLAPPEAIEKGVLGLIDQAAAKGSDIAILEIADGLQHEETATLVQSEALRHRICGFVFAAYDALGAHAGVTMLKRLGHTVFAISGQLTRSPLAIREAAAATGHAVLTAHEVQTGAMNAVLLESAAFGSDVHSITSRIKCRQQPVAFPPVPASGGVSQQIRSIPGADAAIYGWLGHNSANAGQLLLDDAD
jgi:hypothetical protein